jgi:hypothetical protein
LHGTFVIKLREKEEIPYTYIRKWANTVVVITGLFYLITFTFFLLFLAAYMLFITANVIRNGNGCGGPLPPYMLSFDPWFHVTTVILIDCCFCYPSYASDASACRFFCNAAVTNLLAYSAVVGELLLRKRFCCC